MAMYDKAEELVFRHKEQDWEIAISLTTIMPAEISLNMRAEFLRKVRRTILKELISLRKRFMEDEENSPSVFRVALPAAQVWLPGRSFVRSAMEQT